MIRPGVLPLALLAALSPALAPADPYRLTLGDRLEMIQSGREGTEALQVDPDGEVRLPGVGGVPVAGLGLDAAERAIESAVEAAGLFVAPEVSLSVTTYAPVSVAGDVAGPGRFDFVPGMTVASALALSGGSRTGPAGRIEVGRARAELDGQRRVMALEIAAATARIARFEAALADLSEVHVPAEARAALPEPAALGPLLAGEAALLRAARRKAAELLALWADEIATAEAQRTLFDRRIAVQEEIVATAARDLEAARTLEARGLQTRSRLGAAERREADARERALELETARIAAVRAIAEARRARAQFLARERETALEGLQAARLALATARARHGRALAGLAALEGRVTLDGTELAEVRFRLLRPAGEAPALLTEDTALRPGDTLIVRLAPLTEPGG